MKKNLTLLIAAAMMMSMTANAEETELAVEAQTEAAIDVAALAEDTNEDGAVLSEKWSDFQMQIDDQVYQFPMMVPELEAMGWTSDELEGATLEPYSYSYFTFENGENESYVYILNLGKNVEPVANCIVGGMDIDHYDWEDSTSTVTLPGGIVKGEATVDSIKEAYGTPSDVYEGDLYTKLTYDTDYNSYIDMYVYVESGVLDEITVKNFVAPEGYDPGTISEEVPAVVAEYVKPEALSEDPAVYEITLDGENYTLPVPVSVLVADGWELDMNDTDAEVYAKYYGWVTLRKGGVEISTTVTNPEDYGTIPENCWLEEIEIGCYDLEGVDGALPGGIYIGMPEADFLKVLEDNGLSYELYEGSVFNTYTYNDQGYGHSMEVSIYIGDDDHFPTEEVVGVACCNEYEY